MSKQKYTHFEIAVDPLNEKGVFIASQILNILHDALEKKRTFLRWKNRISKRPMFSFEIVQESGKISFFFRVQQQYANFLTNQLYGHFPNIEIIEYPDYLAEKKDFWYTQLKLDRYDLNPIKTYTEFKERTETEILDPLSALTSSMIKGSDHMEVLQVNFFPLYDREWKKKRQIGLSSSPLPRFITRLCLPEENLWLRIVRSPLSFLIRYIFGYTKIEPTPEGDMDEMVGVRKKKYGTTEKLEDFGFATSIVVAHSGNDPLNARARIKEISQSTNIFTVPKQNGFEITDIRRDTKGLVQKRSAHKNMVLTSSELAGIIHLPTLFVQTPGINWVLAKKLEPPHDLPICKEGDDLTPIGKTNFRNMRNVFGSGPNDRRRHFYVIGKTGMGKSTLLENMIYDDIHKGRGVGVVDPHGDLAEKILEFIPKDRTNDVILFDPSDTAHPVAFNMFETVSPEFQPIVASGFVGIFKKMFEDSWGPRLEYILRNTILTLLQVPDTTILSIAKILTNPNYRERVVEKIDDAVMQKFWLNEFARWSPQQAAEVVSPILNKIGQFTSSYMMRNIIGQPTNSFGLRWAMDKGKIVIVNLSKGKIGEDASNMLGAMMVTKFQIDAMSRADIPEKDRRDFYLYVDEFQNFATGSFATILSEARKYKLNLTMANQYVEQMSEEVQGAVFGNVGTIVNFQVGFNDAEMLASTLGPEEIITPNDLTNLKKYQIYTNLLVDGMPSKVFSADTIPPVDLSEDPDLYQEREKIVSVSRSRYAKDQKKVEKRILQDTGGTPTKKEEKPKASSSEKKSKDKK